MGFRVVQGTDLPGVSGYCQQSFRNTEVDYQYIKCMSEDETIAAARDADILMAVPARQTVSRKVIENLPRCRYVLGLVSGYDGIDVKAATEHGILVTNMADLFFEEVSDHTMALILACSRRIVEMNQLVKTGGWVADRMGSRLGREILPHLDRLQGKTLGLIGFGRIARRVAVKAKAFGMKLIAYDPYVAPNVFSEYGIASVGLDQLLAESDFVAVLAPLTDETRGMLGLAQLRKMKHTAYIINAGRGPIINREALYMALTQGLITGAALDVTEPEPSDPGNNPLVALHNVIMTPHSAGQGKVIYANVAQMAVEQVLLVLRGEWPHHLVNPEVKDRYIQRWMRGK